MTDLEQQLTDHLRERAAAATPHYDLEAVEAGLDHYAPVDLDERRRRRLLAAAVVGAAAAVALVVAIAVVREAEDGDAATPVTAPDHDPMTTFVSPRNGFSVEYPEGDAAVTPATQLWGASEQVDDGFDVVETGLGAVFKGASTELPDHPDGVSIDERVDEYLSVDYVLPGGCGVPRSQQSEITIDGQAGRISECANRVEATVVAGGRLYLFTLSHDRSDASAVFDAFVATIDLTPETAVDFPAPTTTFVSPTNGFSFEYYDRGGLAPATDLWDPVNQPLDPINPDGSDETGFDAVETGMLAYFLAASTPIPEGVSIDDWVDQHASPRGYCVPRSQQAEITIDGQSGRISECEDRTGATVDRIDATVVAGGRLYLFTLLHQRSDARAFFDAWVATIDLTPESAAVP